MRAPPTAWRRRVLAVGLLSALSAVSACGPAARAPVAAGSTPPRPAARGSLAPGPALGAVAKGARRCAGLRAAGWPYPRVVDYWQRHDDAPALDPDGNGMPCEAAYPDADVSSYWHRRRPEGLPNYLPGLSCAQLLVWSFSYPQAVAYWYAEGTPARLDDDGNGMPCESVYEPAAVNRYWY